MYKNLNNDGNGSDTSMVNSNSQAFQNTLLR